MKIQLGLRDHRTTYRPGDELEGAVLWESEDKPTSAEVRLIWFTRGKGTEDAGIVATETFSNPQPGDTRQFKFQLPEGPYSFNGKLIALTWAVEFVLEPGDHFQRITITLGPDGEEVKLPLKPANDPKTVRRGKK